jgi:hypothetical protein
VGRVKRAWYYQETCQLGKSGSPVLGCVCVCVCVCDGLEARVRGTKARRAAGRIMAPRMGRRLFRCGVQHNQIVCTMLGIITGYYSCCWALGVSG